MPTSARSTAGSGIRIQRNYSVAGCTGGQHRSVYMAEKLAAELSKRYPQVLTRHTELPEQRAASGPQFGGT